jgi:Coenzyme PQQ synthesis protein D (PqqD)
MSLQRGNVTPAREAWRTFVPAPAIACHELDAETILFDRQTGRIFVLNETAGLVWNALAQGIDCSALADAISAEIGIDRDRFLADCRTLMDQWTAAGLCGNPTRPEAAVASGDGVQTPHLDSTTVDSTIDRLPNLGHAGERRHYRIADLRLNLDGPTTAFGLLRGLLDHLASPDEARTGNAPENAPGNASQDAEPVTLAIAGASNDWTLFLEGARLACCDDDAKLAPLIHATVLHLSYAASQSLVSLHGAAVFSGDGRCVVLPGRPGAGKSTLTAALVSAGLGYCTDDFILLDGDPLYLRGIPLCIGLKTGSWPLLEDSTPGIAALPTHLRADGQQVRYLAPPLERVAHAEERFKVAAIVFPCIAENQPCRLGALTRSAALVRIADAGYHLLGGLDEVTFLAILEWVRSLDCYELSYSDLDEAVTAIGRLLNAETVAEPTTAASL